jgi:hypothetical protein
MTSGTRLLLLAGLAVACMPVGLQGKDCKYEVAEQVKVTHAPGNSHTTRGNATCIYVDDDGVAHLVYEDRRTGEFEIYYAFVRNDTLSPELRITRTPGESSFPCITGGGGSVYILWQEMSGKDFEIEYARIVNGEVVKKRTLSNSKSESSCPVAAYDGDGTLHVAWHEGAYHQTGITYGRVVDDSLVHLEEIPVETPGAFRPDIACDGRGKVLLTWLEHYDVKAKFWNGQAWQETQTVATGKHKAWRHSVAYFRPGWWGAAWFDRTDQGGYIVYAALFDEHEWTDRVRLNGEDIGYYPNVCAGPAGTFQVAWEGKNMKTGEYSLRLRCYDGSKWGETRTLLARREMTRYPSLALDPDGNFRAIWFSDGRGAYEIYYGVLRRL